MKIKEVDLAQVFTEIEHREELKRAGKALVGRPQDAPEPKWAESLAPADRTTIEKLHAGQYVASAEVESAYRAFRAAGGSEQTIAKGLLGLAGMAGISVMGGGAAAYPSASQLALEMSKDMLAPDSQAYSVLGSMAGDLVMRCMFGENSPSLPTRSGEVKVGDVVRFTGKSADEGNRWANGRELRVESLYVRPFWDYVQLRKAGVPDEQIATITVHFADKSVLNLSSDTFRDLEAVKTS